MISIDYTNKNGQGASILIDPSFPKTIIFNCKEWTFDGDKYYKSEMKKEWSYSAESLLCYVLSRHMSNLERRFTESEFYEYYKEVRKALYEEGVFK